MSGSVRPPHLRLRFLALVCAGGAAGTALRAGLTLAVPHLGRVPLAILTANLVGAFALGWLLEALALRGPDEGPRRAARLGLGTGLIGSFTTYSALSADTAALLGAASPAEVLAGLAYGLGSVLAGLAAAFAGIACAAALHRRRTDATERTGGAGGPGGGQP
ncbi:fluoride efflux transporter FluC [Brevibacterium rongguiense]|uniref:fluoride efflux transporter FluC n=1 Tax=Brevibacterium rongguiense TaxID=2695267 RepID=UPI002E2A2747|nr:CrcB family protein [Brevibacterium rongguiense]